jgi:hypothetical protein
VTFDTTGLSTSAVFAVCYTDALGTTSATWVDSGIRLTVSKVVSITYGLPSRTMVSTNVAAATNRLPQTAATVITYAGDLAAGSWLSLVDASLNSDNPDVVQRQNNPCVYGVEAAAAEDDSHSGSVVASGASRMVTIPQSTLLDEANEYAVCYAELDGTAADTTWRDSYLRVRITKVASISESSVTHVTGPGCELGDTGSHICWDTASEPLAFTCGQNSEWWVPMQLGCSCRCSGRCFTLWTITSSFRCCC